MLAEKPDIDEAWETELGIRDFVAREERRGKEFFLEHGTRRRRTALHIALDLGIIQPNEYVIGDTYAADWSRFYYEFRCPSTLDYQNRTDHAASGDMILSAGLRIRRAESVLTPAQRLLVRRVCGEGEVVSDGLLRELPYPFAKLGVVYAERWAVERPHLAQLAGPVADLRALGATVMRRFDIGGHWGIIGAGPLLYAAQGGLCGLCSQRLWPERGSFDHVRPRNPAIGIGRGTRGPGNLLVAHARCNFLKGNDQPTAEQLRCLARVNAILGWDDSAENDPEDQWQILTEGLARLPMAPEPKHYPVPDPGIKSLGITVHEWARRKVALERTLKRLSKLNAEPAKEPPKPRYRPPPGAVVDEPEPEADWNELLPAKPSRSDDTMDQAWLSKAGVTKSNRDMRHLGVQAKSELKVKNRANGRVRKRVKRRRRS